MVCLHLEGKPLRECPVRQSLRGSCVQYPGGTPRIGRAEIERAAGLK